MSKTTLTVELKALRDRVGEAVQFLKSKLEEKTKTKGTQLQIEGARTKEVKLLLHKFLHHHGLNHYRVLSHSGILEVTLPEAHMVRPLGPEASPPTASQTTPYYFPQAPVLVPEKKKHATPKHKHK